MGFIRVRQASGPAHEFDISEAAYKRNKGAYKVIDPKPVAAPRPVKHVQDVPVKAPAKPAKPAAKPAEKEGK